MRVSCERPPAARARTHARSGRGGGHRPRRHLALNSHAIRAAIWSSLSRLIPGSRLASLIPTGCWA